MNVNDMSTEELIVADRELGRFLDNLRPFMTEARKDYISHRREIRAELERRKAGIAGGSDFAAYAAGTMCARACLAPKKTL